MTYVEPRLKYFQKWSTFRRKTTVNIDEGDEGDHDDRG